MQKNRSIPDAVVIPTLAYADVRNAVEWLCDRFGFSERLAIGDHRAQLVFGAGAVVVTALPTSDFRMPDASHSIMVRVFDAELHFRESVQKDVEILNPISDYPYGERQYTARDLGGHIWTFSQTLSDVDPASWGGVLRGADEQKG